MIVKNEEFQNYIPRLFPEEGGEDRRVRSATLQVTDACNLRCTYCYQINKGEHYLDFETAKKYVDILLAGENPYINFENSRGITFEFIGGEPFMAIDLVDKITEYILNKMIKENHPWLFRSRFSFSSNGTLYFQPKVQEYIKKYAPFISIGFSIDGNKELHDSCRIFPDGSGSYDIAVAAAKDYMKRYNEKLNTKMTLAPENVAYTSAAIQNLIDIGYTNVFCNCVYEEGWQTEHATTLYYQLKDLADYLFESNLHDDIFISIFDEESFYHKEDSDDQNWCGGTGDMIAVDYKGDIFPCLRYMESSLGTDAKPLIIGTVDGGLCTTPDQQKCVDCLRCITRSSQSTKECMECPISAGCAWCSAYNYQKFGTANKRATFICVMHKARALANLYFWNKHYKLLGLDRRMENHVPREWALEIIPEEEFDMLLELTK